VPSASKKIARTCWSFAGRIPTVDECSTPGNYTPPETPQCEGPNLGIGGGSLANTEWTLLDIQLGPLGEVALVDDPAALCWFSSHHNFIDWARAWTGSRHFDIKIEGFNAASRTYLLYTFEQGPIDASACAPTITGYDCIGEPIELPPVNP
jgi:hypothetical protein